MSMPGILSAQNAARQQAVSTPPAIQHLACRKSPTWLHHPAFRSQGNGNYGSSPGVLLSCHTSPIARSCLSRKPETGQLPPPCRGQPTQLDLASEVK